MAVDILKWMANTSIQRAVAVNLFLHHCRMKLRQSYLILEKLFSSENDGWSGLVKVKSFSLDETNVLRIIVTNSNGDYIITTKEHLRSPNNTDVGWIPISVTEYKQSAKTLSEEDIEKITLPKHFSQLQQDLQAQPSSIYDYVTAI